MEAKCVLNARRAELDGLRAVACLMVVAHHAGVPLLRGGLLGVDLFFVLSGYLITDLLLRELQSSGRVAMKEFYLRRAARLYPALLLTLPVVLIWAPELSSPHKVVAALLYLGEMGGVTGRFMGAWSHTWSLAIEEHFYLVWPFVVMLVRRRRALILLTSLMCVFSVATILWSSAAEPMSAFIYSSDVSRAWEILAGCLLAMILPLLRIPSWGQRAFVALGIVSFACAAMPKVDPEAGRMPVLAAQVIATVISGCALLAGMAGESGAGRIFTLGPLVWIGKRSYGIYLFHFPMYAHYQAVGRAVPYWVIPLPFVLAAASFRLLEQPVISWAKAFNPTDSIYKNKTVPQDSR